MSNVHLDDEVESIEELGETEAEQIDEETEWQDYESDEDEIFGEEAEESDLEHAYDSFMTNNEADYDGWNDAEVDEAADLDHSSEVLESQPDAFHLEDEHDLEDQVIEMEIEDGDIYAVIVDEDDNEIGFVLLDEDGREQEYYYVDDPDGEFDEDGEEQAHAVRASDGEEFDLGLTRDQVTEATDDLNEIYRDGAEVVQELKETFSDITDSLDFIKKKPKVDAAHPKNPMTGR